MRQLPAQVASLAAGTWQASAGHELRGKTELVPGRVDARLVRLLEAALAHGTRNLALDVLAHAHPTGSVTATISVVSAVTVFTAMLALFVLAPQFPIVAYGRARRVLVRAAEQMPPREMYFRYLFEASRRRRAR